jgi:hypothetical protein
MALIGNYSLINKSSTRFFGGSTTSVEVQMRSNFNRSGPSRNMYCQAASGEYNVPGAEFFDEATSIPNGYGIYGWIPATHPGGMSCNSTKGSSVISLANLYGGYSLALPGTTLVLAGSGHIYYAAGNLGGPRIAALVGSGTISDANVFATSVIAAALLGSGTISYASLGGAAEGIASLVGSGTITSASLLGALIAAAGLVAVPTVPIVPISSFSHFLKFISIIICS